MWVGIFHLQEHRAKKEKLNKSPKDDNDLIYHTSALEDGYDPVSQIKSLLSRTSFEGLLQGFANDVCPVPLRRGCLEKVTGHLPLQYH
jgi:hypothetical protein